MARGIAGRMLEMLFAGVVVACAGQSMAADERRPVAPPATIEDRAVLKGEGMAFVVTLSCMDPAASIGYRLAPSKSFAGPWIVYTGPFEAPADRRFIEVRTHLPGHEPAVTGGLLGGE